MTSYFLLKWIHILSAIVLFGTGLGSAFYKYMSHRARDVRAIALTDRLVVLADWLFTTPTIIIQPLTGLAMLSLAGISLSTPWVALSLALYLLAGACWLPVVWLQIRMRAIAGAAAAQSTSLPAAYGRYMRIWFWLGVPAFAAMVGVVALMVLKPAI
jgi:uncharacterized membrane protein